MQFPDEMTPSEFSEAYQARDEHWRAVVEHLLRREGFAPRELELLSGSNLAYSVDDRYVIKAFPPDGSFEGVIERDLLRACSADGIFATPELVASGVDGWQWVVMTKLPGRELRLVRDGLSPQARLRVAEQLSDWMAEFRNSAGVQGVALERPERWGALQAELRAGVADKHRARGLTESWLQQLPDFYRDWEPVDEVSVIHADLHDMNILVTEGADGWELSGVFDFADAMRAPLLYELAAPLLYVARGARQEVESLCMRTLGEVPESRVLLQWALLHRFSNLQYYLDHFDYIAEDVVSLEEVARAVAGL